MWNFLEHVVPASYESYKYYVAPAELICMYEYVDETPVLRVTIYDKTATYLNCTIIHWFKVVFLPGII